MTVSTIISVGTCINAQEFTSRLSRLKQSLGNRKVVPIVRSDLIEFQRPGYLCCLSSPDFNPVQGALEQLIENNKQFLTQSIADGFQHWRSILAVQSDKLQNLALKQILKDQIQNNQRIIEKGEKGLILLKTLRKRKTHSDVLFTSSQGEKHSAHFCALQEISFFQAKSAEVMRHGLGPISTENPLEINLEEYSAETIEHFLDYQYGVDLPENYDSNRLFQLADYFQDEGLMKKILFSKIEAKDDDFALKVLTSSVFSFSDEEKERVFAKIKTLDFREMQKPFTTTYLELADREFPFAQLILGFYYSQKGNHSEAMRFLQSAAKHELALAQEMIGFLYQLGEGGSEQNDLLAFKFFKLAADHGMVIASRKVATYYERDCVVPKDLAQALKYYKIAAQKKDAFSLGMLGYYYYKGQGGVRQDYDLAFRYFQNAADQGDASSEAWLGFCYYLGRGAARDVQKGLALMKRASEKGNKEFLIFLASIYEHGLEVSRDLQEAIQWYRRSADTGLPEAIEALNRLGANTDTRP